MNKDVQISSVMVKTPVEIVVDGVKYPRTGRNIQVVKEYWESDDETALDKLSTIALDFG